MSAVTGAASGAAVGHEAILEGLNPRQAEAVSFGDGPLLIVAGAGTGKTQVITRRIAWLIAAKRARPEQILALTYMEKAAAEMESRVDVLVPYGYTGTTISTFHAFGDRLLREFGVELGITSNLQVCTEAEVVVFLREHLFDLGLERYAPLGQPDAHLRNLLGLFNRARDEDVSPEEYEAFAARLAAEAGNNDERRDRAEAEVEKARAYGRYRKLMLENGRVDFGDQVALALRLLRERPHVRRQLQERYRYVLVDEFQDTNHAQFEMLQLLAGDRRNLTVVGDDDQSIYRFRGAKLANLLSFLNTFPDATTVVLTENYRSRQNLLDSAYRLIQNNNPDRLEARSQGPGGARRFDKRLRAVAEGPARIEYLEFATRTDEAIHVAATIAEEIRSGRRSPRDFAILGRRHRDLVPFLNALQGEGIPYQQTAQRSLYARDEVRLALSMLRVVADPDHSISVFHLLGSPLFGAEGTELARLSSHARRRNLSLWEVLPHLDPGRLGFEPGEPTRLAVTRFVDLVRKLAHYARQRSTTEVLYAFVQESGLLAGLMAQGTAEAEEQIRNLAKLFNIARRIGELLEHDRVDSFIRHLDLLIEAGDDPAAVEVELEMDAIQAITAHGAKGREFPVVFMVALADGIFPPWGRSDPFALPAELVKEPPTQGDAEMEEERRLFYVGMTRAREELWMTWAADYGGKVKRKAGRFVAEARGVAAAPRSRRGPDAREAIERFAPDPEPTTVAPPIGPDDLLELSDRRIDDYLTCPYKYRFAHVAQVPLARDHRFMFGDAMHHAIHVYFKHRIQGLPIEAEDVIAVFEDGWSPEGFLSREHEERRLEQGRDALRHFLERETASEYTPVAVERSFKFRQGNNVVRGRWDRIDQRPEGVVIVDFKTSDVEETEDAQRRADESIRKQLGLYTLAYREMYGEVPKRVELCFVDTGATGAVEVRPEHLEVAARRIELAAEGIRAGDFAARPEYKACGNCPYNSFCQFSVNRSRA